MSPHYWIDLSSFEVVAENEDEALRVAQSKLDNGEVEVEICGIEEE